MGYVLPDALGLGDSGRIVRPVLYSVLSVHSLPPDDFHGGGAVASASDRRREIARGRGALKRIDATNLPSQRKLPGTGQHYWRRRSDRAARVRALGDHPFSVVHRSVRGQAAARALQPPPPRGGAGDRLPVLPHVGRKIIICGYSTHPNVHDLPLPNLDECRNARAGEGELSDGPVAGVDSRERAA